MLQLMMIFSQGGTLMYTLVIVLLVVVGLIVRTSWELFVRRGSHRGVIQDGLDGMLFWGGFAVMVGVLGSVVGYHRSISTVVAYGIVNPRAVWIGLAEGLVSSIAGVLVLAFAGAWWFVLHLASRRRSMA